MQVEQLPQGVPDVFKQLFWDPATTSDAQPVNATEDRLAQLIDAKHCVRSVNSITKFIQALQKAKTEADQALVLVVLRATATGSDAKLAAACTSAFEKCGGLKIAKQWLNEAVEWNYSDLLVLLLDVLKVLPVQLTSITEARINEPIVKLRKTAQEDKVKRAAQDLLKHWRGRFTAKEKEKTKATSSSNTSGTVSTSTTAATPASSAKPEPKAPTTTPPASAPKAPTGLKAAAEASAKEAKRRPIKWLEQAPPSLSKSSELIGNLMQRKSAKDAAASSKLAKESSSDNKESRTSSSGSSSKQVSSGSPSEKAPKAAAMTMQLPAIQSFKAVATTTVSKKIRWADEEGKELVKVKLIESWRDMIHHSPHDENSFKDAKLREHEAERMAMKSHKEREAFHVVLAHEWSTPALLRMPEALTARRNAVLTEEVDAQSARTRREMEFLVLDGEVPPVSPKEWTRTNEPHRGPPKEIPLLDVDAAAAASAGKAPVAVYGEPPETDEERALREALGPLQRSTIHLLMENEHVLPAVYEEAQRNGNRIPDGRVVEIIDFHRRQAAPHQYNQPPHHHPPPPHHQQQSRNYNTQPPPSSQAYDTGYSKYGGGGAGGYSNGPPPPVAGGAGPGGFEYNRQYGGSQPPPMHHQPLKRKAPGGFMADGPPGKRPPKRGPHGEPLQCMYFLGPGGCKHGSNCQYAHDTPGGPPPGAHMGMGQVDYGNSYGPPQGGRFGGHQQPMGMRGGGGMRGMRR